MGAALCCRRPRRVQDESSTVTYAGNRGTQSPAIGRVLVFVNPKSGSGKSLVTLRDRVEPKLKKNHIDYDVVITSGPNHAKSAIRSRDDLGEYNGIIILSGDGLVFEVLNGFIERHDATSIIPSLPIGIVPSGSGNGLLSSLFYSRGEPLKNPKFTERAIDVSCSPEAHAQPVNLIHVQTDREDIASFLSVGWGLMADIDIESERWRKLFGSNRFALGGLVRILNLRTYRGRLWYKPYSGSYGEVDVSYDVYAKTVSERVALSHISNEGPFAPQARMNDDRIYLTYILRNDVSSKLDLLKFLTSIESHKHLELPFVKAIEVSAFRLEPQDSGSYLVVDGEIVRSQKIQAVTTTLKMAVFAPKRGCIES
uniref:DAGKc domain-containing protein n=1 Tax=Haemonchus contortus TaxID=6289 RepID=A0A7I4Y519_HAECO